MSQIASIKTGDAKRKGGAFQGLTSTQSQGSQGVQQLKFDLSSPDEAKKTGPAAFDERTSETRALLSVEESPFDILLQRLYYNPKCQFFYMGLMGVSILLVLTTVIFGFKVGQEPFFIFVESILNLVVLGDFLCRVKLQGVRRFIEGGMWNIFDAIVVLGCVFIFALMMISRSLSILFFEELSEEILLVGWSLF